MRERNSAVELYRSPLVDEAFEKALELLEERMGEWRSVVDAYFLLRKHESEVGFPFTYNMVEELVERVHERLTRGRAEAAVEARA